MDCSITCRHLPALCGCALFGVSNELHTCTVRVCSIWSNELSLPAAHRLISVGVEFCGVGSDSLQDSMRQQSLKYFRNYHRYWIW